MVPDSIHIYDEGDLRKYRTEIPNIIDDMHLSPHAYRLYGHLKRVAGAGGGSCWQNTETLSKACDMATGMISKAKAELVKAGLIVIDKKRVGKNDVDDIKIVDIWAENFAAFAGMRSQEQATRSQYETVQAGTNSQYETKKEPVKKEPIKNNNLRANDARAEPPQAMLFDDSLAAFAPKPPVTPPEKKPRQPDTYLDTIMLLWQVPAQRAATIKQQLQGRVPTSKPHHHTNLSPPVELEEAIEFATRYYPRACKGCSLPKSPEKLQDHIEAMRREKGKHQADIQAGGVNLPDIGYQPIVGPEFDYYE